MTIIEKQNRIQFLQSLQTGINSVIAQLTISGNRVGAKVVEGNYNLKSKSNITKLLLDLDKLQDEERLNLYTTFTSGINNMMGLSVSQLQQRLNNKKAGVNLINAFAGMEDRVDSFLNDEKIGKLLTKIWTDKDKAKVVETVIRSIGKGSSAFELSEELTKVIGKGSIRSNIDRVANTELVRAYNKASYDVIKESKGILEEDFDTYINVFLSPYHPEEDICDDLVGNYDIGDAPIPPHHPNCICGYKEVILPKGKGVSVNEINRADVLDIQFS
jgi:hypothetical protein